MFGQIANYCPIISRSSLVKNSTSLESIWQTIRRHFGFQVTEAHFIDLSDIYLEPNERPEDLFQQLMAFVEDSLLKTNGLAHHGVQVDEDEELSPTLENTIVFLTWLKLIHPSLPKLVKQRYGTELRSRTLASIKLEISQALESLLQEIHAADDAKALRSAVSSDFGHNLQRGRTVPKPPRPRIARQEKSCPLCKQAGRSDTRHFLSQCEFLPDSDKRYMVKAHQIVDILDEEPSYDNDLNPFPSHAAEELAISPPVEEAITLPGRLPPTPHKPYNDRQRSYRKHDTSIHRQPTRNQSHTQLPVRTSSRWFLYSKSDR